MSVAFRGRLKSFIGTRRVDDHYFCFNILPMRPDAIRRALSRYQGAKILLVKTNFQDGLQDDEGVDIYFNKKRERFTRSIGSYSMIKEDRDKKSANYIEWGIQSASMLDRVCVQRNQQSNDLLPLAGRLDTDIHKLASKKHPFLVEQLFDSTFLAEIERWDEAEQKLKETEEDDEFEPAHEGTVYWADTLSFPGILKNGGSRYDGATRVHQLFSAGVPVPYVCRLEKRVPDWKLFEGVVHEYFKAFRVYERKEFFSYSLQDAIKLINQVDGVQLFSEEEKERWDCAMAKVSIRLTKNRIAWAKKKAKLDLVKSKSEESLVKQLMDANQKLVIERDEALNECSRLKQEKLEVEKQFQGERSQVIQEIQQNREILKTIQSKMGISSPK